MPLRWQITLIPGWHGVLIGTTCLLQILISMFLDRHYDHRLFRHFFWMIWYPLAYWLLNMLVTVWALPKVFIRKRGRRAVWISPDRGLRTPSRQTEIKPAPLFNTDKPDLTNYEEKKRDW